MNRDNKFKRRCNKCGNTHGKNITTCPSNKRNQEKYQNRMHALQQNSESTKKISANKRKRLRRKANRNKASEKDFRSENEARVKT